MASVCTGRFARTISAPETAIQSNSVWGSENWNISVKINAAINPKTVLARTMISTPPFNFPIIAMIGRCHIVGQDKLDTLVDFLCPFIVFGQAKMRSRGGFFY